MSKTVLAKSIGSIDFWSWSFSICLFVLVGMHFFFSEFYSHWYNYLSIYFFLKMFFWEFSLVWIGLFLNSFVWKLSLSPTDLSSHFNSDCLYSNVNFTARYRFPIGHFYALIKWTEFQNNTKLGQNIYRK